VSGAGKHELKVGENTITVVITAENGSKNNITIKVTRKDGYYLEDLDSLLNDNNVSDVAIIINSDSKISNTELEKIKNSKKEVKFNYFDESKKLLYSWTVDGSKVNDLVEFVTTMSFVSENKEKISELSNYADGLYMNFSHKGKLPNNTKIKVYFGDKYENNNLLNVYHYNADKLDLVKEKLAVVDGYIEFEIERCSEYFVTRAILNKTNNNNVLTDGSNSMNLSWILVCVELVVIIVLVILLVKKHNLKNATKQETLVENKVEKNTNTVNNIFHDEGIAFVNESNTSVNDETEIK